MVGEMDVISYGVRLLRAIPASYLVRWQRDPKGNDQRVPIRTDKPRDNNHGHRRHIFLTGAAI